MILKPQIPIIDWGNPISKKLVFAAPVFERGGNPTELVYKLKSTQAGVMTWVTDIFGSGVTTGTSGGAAKAFIFGANNNTWTLQKGSYSARVIVIRTGTSSANFDRIFTHNTSGTNSWGFNLKPNANGNTLYWDHFHGAVETAVTSDIALSTTKIEPYMSTWDGTNLRLYRSGIQVATTTIGSLDSTSNTVRIGCSSNNNDGAPVKLFTAELWDRCLSAQEVYSLYQNPWQIYTQLRLVTNLR